MSSRYRRLLIYDVKRTTKIDGMGPFKHRTVDSSMQFMQIKDLKLVQADASGKLGWQLKMIGLLGYI